MKIDDKKLQGINQIGYFGKSASLGESSRLMLEAIKKAEIPVSLISANDLISHVKDEPFLYPIDNIFKYSINLFTIDSTQITTVIQKHGWDQFKSRYNIGLVFWETTSANSEHIKAWNYLDEIWTASRYMQEVISRLVSIPVHRIPQPIELNYRNPINNKTLIGIPNRFTFLFIFSFGSILARKNPQAIIEAFQIAFSSQDNVQLIIKSKEAHFHLDQYQMMKRQIEGLPHVLWLEQIMDEKKRFDLINNCDCYISLHRSEGFGLTMSEAMLLEKPVIATGYSGNLDFMSDENSFLCSCHFVEIGKGHPPYPPKGLWADPNIFHAAQLMRQVFENKEEASLKAKKGREFIQHQHNFNRVGSLIKQRLVNIKPPIKSKSVPWHFLQTQFNNRRKKAINHLKKPFQLILKKFI